MVSGLAINLLIIEEVGQIDSEQECDHVQAAGADPILAALVLLYLLQTDAESTPKRRLAHAPLPTQRPQPCADRNVILVSHICREPVRFVRECQTR